MNNEITYARSTLGEAKDLFQEMIKSLEHAEALSDAALEEMINITNELDRTMGRTAEEAGVLGSVFKLQDALQRVGY